jgi:hypothetical protein
VTGPAEQHLDLDALADVLAEEGSGAALPEHLQTCATCVAELDALRSAVEQVRSDLGALPPVPPVPADLDERFRAAIAATPAGTPAGTLAGTTVLPAAQPASLEEARSRRGRWMAVGGGLAAAAVLVVGGGLLLNRGATDSSSNATAARSRPSGQFPISSTGTDYRSNASLQAALPSLLASQRTATDSQTGSEKSPLSESPSRVPTPSGGSAAGPMTAQSGVDPLAGLRTPQGLASCLAALSDPKDPGLPLALDYALYKGAPALIVVLPSAKASKVDIWVVGAGCTQQDAQLKLYLRADRSVR